MTESGPVSGNPTVARSPLTWPVALSVTAGYAAGTALMWIAIGYSDRHPLDWIVFEFSFAAMNIAAGILLRHWAALSLTLIALGLGVGAGLLAGGRTTADDDPLGDALMFVFVLVAVPILIAAGVAIGKEMKPSLPSWAPVRAASYACLAIMALPLAKEIYDHDRVVHADRDHPVLLNERAGSFDGVPMGADRDRVIAAFGPIRKPEPKPNKHGITPAYNVATPEARLSMFDGRLREVDPTDDVETIKGIGIGDSLSLAKDAYPGLRCNELSQDSDFLDPYPVCQVDTGPGLTLHIDATYDDPGVPISDMWLTSRVPRSQRNPLGRKF